MASLKLLVIGTMAQIKNETLDPDILYEITDYPVGGITNAQMTNALSPDYNAFFRDGEVFVCTDNGTYKKGHSYKFTGIGWEDITPASSTPSEPTRASEDIEIPVNGWVEDNSIRPFSFKYQTSFSEENTAFEKVTLIGNPIDLASYGLVIGEVVEDVVTFYAQEKPARAVTVELLFENMAVPEIATDENGDELTDEDGEPLYLI